MKSDLPIENVNMGLGSFEKNTSAMNSGYNSFTNQSHNHSNEHTKPPLHPFILTRRYQSPGSEYTTNHNPRLHSYSSVEDSLSQKLKSLMAELNDSEEVPSHRNLEIPTDDCRQAEYLLTGNSDDSAIAPKLRWCPYCACESRTEVTAKPTDKTLWSSIGILLSGGLLGCFFIPYMSKTCHEYNYVCKRCQHRIS